MAKSELVCFHDSTGEALQVTLEITNRSSRTVKPKFTLYEKQSFFAQGKRKVHTRNILKEKAETVESSKKETVTQVINLPRELPSSILNCSIIKLEYRLKVNIHQSVGTNKTYTRNETQVTVTQCENNNLRCYFLQVYLDIKCAVDPEIKIPIVVLPTLRRPAEKCPPASAGIGLEAFGGSAQSQRTMLPRQQAGLHREDQPPSYEACMLYPPFLDQSTL